MVAMIRQTIKNHRDFIPGSSDIDARTPFFLVRARPAHNDLIGEYGLVVTKRAFRHAVDRNRAKRMLRDWIAHNEQFMASGFDYIFLARAAILGASRIDGRAAMHRALNHISKSIRDTQDATK